jgi:hypothetical protein
MTGRHRCRPVIFVPAGDVTSGSLDVQSDMLRRILSALISRC